MKFIGEHLFPGQLGHFFVILAFIASLLSTISFYYASVQKGEDEYTKWISFAKRLFYIQSVSVLLVFAIVFYICSNHLYEYMYAYKHASKELEYKYLLACIWEGQEGSFLLWAIWHAILGCLLIFSKPTAENKTWVAPVMTFVSLAQFFLLMMILGIYFFNVRIGNSLFTLTRNEIPAPIFSQANYLEFVKDGMGLNVLLRNYWMVIHPPVLFLGFASALFPFAYAYAGLQQKKFGDWVKPVLPWALFSACVLGVGIMMGGKWAYESLSFGGYWAWDPVENASLVPWMIMVSGIHTLVIYKATGHSLRVSYVFIFLALILVLYSTFLTRTGILGDTSVHSFTEAGKAINTMILVFVLIFTIIPFVYFFVNYKNIPSITKEESLSSREFWMYIGSLALFLCSIFIIAKTSIPVYNKLFNKKIAPPEDIEFSYNKVVIIVVFIIAILTAIVQFFRYKENTKAFLLKGIVLPTVISSVIALLLSFVYPYQYYKHGSGFLGAVYATSFAAVFALVGNATYLFKNLKGKFLHAGGSITHFGFALMIIGILISSSNKVTISDSRSNGIMLPGGIDPMTKKADNPTENLTLLRNVPTQMGNFRVTYTGDSSGHEKGRLFYSLDFDSKTANEKFTLKPDVYQMKDNNMSSNPDIRSYLTHDVFTYVSSAMNKKANVDTQQFKIHEVAIGDTLFFSKGIMILKGVSKAPNNEKYHFNPGDLALMADLNLITSDGKETKARPAIFIDNAQQINPIDDTIYAQNLMVRFAGVSDLKKIKIGVKESNNLIDFVTVKAYIFPYINLVWIGLIIMAIGFLISMIKRAGLSNKAAIIILVVSFISLFYMFLIANA